MRKKIGTLLIVGSLGALCAGLAACSDDTLIDEYFKDGSVISVTYDANGGSIAGGEDVTLVDMFNPEKYKADESGTVHIKLRAPTDENRPKPGGESVKVTRSGYSLVGWYQTRTPATNEDGKVIDEQGNVLVKQGDSYYLESEGSLVRTNPKYTYSDPWNFAEDKVEFKLGDEKKELTLYAGWVELFTFEYYYQVGNVWTQYGTTNFDVTDSAKRDTVYVPDWGIDGKMNYKNNTVGYTFPSVTNMTFEAAYTDETCTNPITESYQHKGTVDDKTATASGSVEKIYVKFMEGNCYRISTAKQFADIGDATGRYTIVSENVELDFKCGLKDNALTFGEDSVMWPFGLMTAEFTGSIEGEGGKAVTFKNVGAQYAEDSNATLGGLFGSIAEGAALKNVTFENVILEILSAKGTRGGNFGLLAGNIDDNAQLQNVSISGELRIGQMSVSAGTDGLNVHLLANGKIEGITSDISLIIFGNAEYGSDEFTFSVDPEETVLAEDGTVTIKYTTRQNRRRPQQYYNLEYQTVNGGDGNE